MQRKDLPEYKPAHRFLLLSLSFSRSPFGQDSLSLSPQGLRLFGKRDEVHYSGRSLLRLTLR
ncbi:hypothetical protein H6F97_02370 [Microcoleus sp. FACHB-1]|nr:hypothetical protein [Microcoleus sp. FACHB-1]